jgi:Fe-S cluster assembly scaffold protein SufB
MIDKKFVERAMTLYEKLPQERSEVYKDHFVSVPFELKDYVAAGAHPDSEKKELANLLNKEFGGFNVKFDAAIGSMAHTAIGGAYMKIENVGRIADKDMKMRMHRSDEDKYTAFIDAYSKEYVFVDVPEGKEARLSVLFSNGNSALNTQVFVSVGEGSKLSLSEVYTSRASSTSSLGIIHEVRAGKNSVVEINAVHNENANTVVLGVCKGRVEEGAKLVHNSVYIGDSHTRVRNSVEAYGMGSRVEVNETVVGSAGQKFDINTFVVNSGKETEANLNSRAALMDSSLCMLKGFAMMKKGAAGSKSDVNQRGIMLDKGARMYALPDMSIDENDVRATHSSATAPVDEDAVFYITSRGVAEQDVRKLIVTGFFANGLSRMSDYALREIGMSLVREKLKNKTFGQTPKIETADMWAANESPLVSGYGNR